MKTLWEQISILLSIWGSYSVFHLQWDEIWLGFCKSVNQIGELSQSWLKRVQTVINSLWPTWFQILKIHNDQKGCATVPFVAVWFEEESELPFLHLWIAMILSYRMGRTVWNCVLTKVRGRLALPGVRAVFYSPSNITVYIILNPITSGEKFHSSSWDRDVTFLLLLLHSPWRGLLRNLNRKCVVVWPT